MESEKRGLRCLLVNHPSELASYLKGKFLESGWKLNSWKKIVKSKTTSPIGTRPNFFDMISFERAASLAGLKLGSMKVISVIFHHVIM